MKNHVYLMDVRSLEDGSLFRFWYQRMPPERRGKIDALRFDRDQRLSLGAGILLNRALRREDVDPIQLTLGRQGKPFLSGREDVQFNLSHSECLAACAVSDRPVGVDIERETHFDEALTRFVFSEDEIAWVNARVPDRDIGFTALWTIKESLMKYLGEGMGLEPRRIHIDPNKPIRATSAGVPLDGVHFARYAVQNYQLTVCSEYAHFSDNPEWIILTCGTGDGLCEKQ